MSKPPEEGRCEEEAARLLPWYVAGRLDAADAERVTRHLERCAICRDDLAHERTLRALLKSESGVEYAPQPGLAKTLAREFGKFGINYNFQRVVADANANLPRLARLAEVWEKVTHAARDTEAFNLERKPLVFSVFGLLAEATR